MTTTNPAKLIIPYIVFATNEKRLQDSLQGLATKSTKIQEICRLCLGEDRTMRWDHALTLIAVGILPVSSFAPRHQRIAVTGRLLPLGVKGRYFQLEELEDKETATTEVFLRPDSTVDVMDTDGPVFNAASGTWSQTTAGEFEMILKRAYPAGSQSQESTDMGEFEYEVERNFVGEISRVGGTVSVSGSMHHVDEEFGDQKVGYFSMIETTGIRKDESGF